MARPKQVFNKAAVCQLTAAQKIQPGSLLETILQLMRSNMSGDGAFSDKQINNQAKLAGVAIRLVDLELRMNRAHPTPPRPTMTVVA